MDRSDRNAQVTLATPSSPAVAQTNRKGVDELCKWSRDEIDVLIEWLSRRDSNGEPYNAVAFKRDTTGAAKKVLQQTELVEMKPEVTQQMVRHKMHAMNASFVALRNEIESPGWGIDGTNFKTIKSYIRKKCPWYYEFEDLMDDNLNTVVPPFLIESGHPDREYRRPVDVENAHKKRPRSSRSNEDPVVAKRTKPKKPVVEILSSTDEDDERPAKKGKTSRPRRTIGDAMVEVERMRQRSSRARIRESKNQAIRFEKERKRRDLEHKLWLEEYEKKMQIQNETILRLQRQLENARRESSHHAASPTS